VVYKPVVYKPVVYKPVVYKPVVYKPVVYNPMWNLPFSLPVLEFPASALTVCYNN